MGRETPYRGGEHAQELVEDLSGACDSLSLYKTVLVLLVAVVAAVSTWKCRRTTVHASVS